MLGEVLAYLNNHFVRGNAWGTEAEADGVTCCSPEDYVPGQYIRIYGSVLNDGVYKIASIDGDKLVTVETLQPEASGFNVWGLAVPAEVVKLATEIAAYQTTEKPGVASESLGDYSVSYAAGSSSAPGWVWAFKDRLRPWRKVYDTSPIRKG
jgi:hypothetical protein